MGEETRLRNSINNKPSGAAKPRKGVYMKKSIKRLIEENLMVSLRQFEKKAGVTRQTIYNIFNNKCKPTVLTVKKICVYFGVDYKDYI